jgi:hypothetical protein
MQSDRNNLNYPSGKRGVTVEEFLHQAAQALKQLSPEDKAKVRQRVLRHLGLEQPEGPSDRSAFRS